jgi:hypothetical protein
MFSGFRAPLGAMFMLVLAAGPASAGSAVSSADMIVREGPGDEFKMLWTVAAGSQVDVRECNPFQWCFVTQRDREGWVHVRRIDEAPGRRGGGAGVADSGGPSSSTAMNEQPGSPGDPGGSKGGKSRKSPTSGVEGISAIDGASLPGNDSGGGGGRTSPGSQSTPGGSSGSDGSAALATAPKGPRF